MTSDHPLEKRLASGEVILLDGAVGTQLQQMGAPMNNTAWAATALNTHPFTVRRMHENYIKAGVDIITVNSYSSARHNLEPLGLGDLTAELNLRAVVLAQEARDRVAGERPIYIAGSVSNFGIMAGGESRGALHRHAHERSEISEDQAKANLREQAELLAEAGVDLLLVESTGGNAHRKWVLEACLSTGLPTWVGFRCRFDESDSNLKVGYDSDVTLGEELEDIMTLGGSVINVFHSSLEATSAAVEVVRKHWQGPAGVYPEADRTDYTLKWRDSGVPTRVTPDDYVELALGWVNQGVQIIGGCCGIELEYIRPLRDALPTHIPNGSPPLSRS